MAKYTIRISGYGNEITIGHLDREIKEKVIDLFSQGNSLESIFTDYDVIACGWSGLDDTYHNFNTSEDFLLTVQKDGEDVVKMTHEEIREQGIILSYQEFEDASCGLIDNEFAVCCVSGEKGEFFFSEIDAEDFDISKLEIKMHCDVGTDFYMHGDMVGKVLYDGEILDNEGGDTTGKYFSVYMDL